MDDTYDLTHARKPASITSEWNERAVRLAVERDMIGQAVPVGIPTPTFASYRCTSATEPDDHYVTLFTRSGPTVCDCIAGQHGKPCSHAGAVLLLANGLATPRRRDNEADANANANT